MAAVEDGARSPRVSFVLDGDGSRPDWATTIDSVLAQSVDDWELLVVGEPEGAETGTPTADRRVRSVSAPLPTGPGSGAPNVQGLAAATGSLLCFLAPGDQCDPEFLESMLRWFDRTPGLVLASCRALVRGPGDPAAGRPQPSSVDAPHLEAGTVEVSRWLAAADEAPCLAATVMRTDAARAVGAVPSHGSGAEALFLARVAVRGRVGSDPRCLLTHRPAAAEPGRATGGRATELEEAQAVLTAVRAEPALRPFVPDAVARLDAAARAGRDDFDGRRPAAARATGRPWWVRPFDALASRVPGRVDRSSDRDAAGRGVGSAVPAEETEWAGRVIRAAGNAHRSVVAVLLQEQPPPARVLDLGAGSGALCQRLVDAGYPAVEAADLDGLEFVAPGVPIHVLDLDDPGFPDAFDGRFDAIVSVEVIEHLAAPTRFIGRAASLLAPGGVLVISSPNAVSWEARISFLRDGSIPWFNEFRWEKEGHRHPLFDWQIHSAAAEAGLTVTRTTATDDRMLWAKRFGNDRRSRRALVAKLLRPMMTGATEGELRIWVLRRADG